jgi:hypothetical protein
VEVVVPILTPPGAAARGSVEEVVWLLLLGDMDFTQEENSSIPRIKVYVGRIRFFVKEGNCREKA